MSADWRTERENDSSEAQQLELFAADIVEPELHDTTVSRRMAFGSISPGWWHLVSAFFPERESEVLVRCCKEVDGVLVLDAATQEAGERPEWLDSLMQRICDTAARTCGCCGRGPAARLRPQFGGPARVACAECSQRLRAGESFLAIADQYWRLDGSPRRPQPAANARPGALPGGITGARREVGVALEPAELRTVINEMREVMLRELLGQDEAATRLSLLATMHVAGGMTHGARALIIGPSGSGKGTSIIGMRRAFEEGGWNVISAVTEGSQLSSVGWAGPSIGSVIESALGNEPPDSARGRHMLVVVDEIHHVGVPVGEGLHGNMAAKRREVLSTLLPLAAHGSIMLGEGTREWSSKNALVIFMGAFTDLLDTESPRANRSLTSRALIAAGLPLELHTRMQELIWMRPLQERALREVLERWPELVTLGDVCKRLGYTVRIHKEAYARAAHAVAHGHDRSTPRTAGGWLVSALRDALTVALADPAVDELVITPDSLAIPAAVMQRQPPHEPPGTAGSWDVTGV